MKLFIDTSTSNLSIGITDNNLTLIDKISLSCWQKQSELLVSEINKLLVKNKIEFSSLNCVVVSRGPGSYTGVRIALTVAKIISIALNIELRALSSLSVLKDGNYPSICLINARSGRSYFAIYEGSKCIVNDCIKSNDEILSFIKDNPHYHICSDSDYLNLPLYKSDIIDQMINLYNYAEVFDNANLLKPLYLKD